MNDCRQKPLILRAVVHDWLLSDEKWPAIDSLISQVRTNGLLSELPSTDAWRSAVDDWVELSVSHASSSKSYECWAGSSLLGVTCEECCDDRFQSSYAIWFHKLLENLQSPSAIELIKVACCASLSALFTRLTSFPNLEKDGTLLSRKVIQPILLMLNEDSGETLLDPAANLLCTLLSFFPSSLRQHYDDVKGNEHSCCLVIQKILIAINSILTDVFQGFEEEKKSSEIMKMIVPSGKDHPLPLGGQTFSGEASQPATGRLRQLLVPRVTNLMHSCCIMLTYPCPFSVSIHVRSMLATVERVLQVDGSCRVSLFPLTAFMHQELCAELPALHLGSLDFLTAIIEGLRRQFLPHSANVVRLLIEYFRRARMPSIPSIRIKVYSILQMLLISMDVEMPLAQEVITYAFADLTDNLELGGRSTVSNMQSSIVVNETFQKNPIEVDLSIKTYNKKSQAPLGVKIAALKALESLLIVGGSLMSESLRSGVDCLVVTLAINACDAGWANEDKFSMLADESSFADYQLATLKALLASLLSLTQTRPPYLYQGLDLFKRGRQKIGSEISAFCAYALLLLEGLLHPRALPLVDHQNLSVDEGFNQRFAGNTFNNGIKTNLPSFSKGNLGLLDEEDEELSSGWLDKNDGQTFSERRNLNDNSNETTKQLSNASEDITMKPLAINEEDSHHVLARESIFLQNVDVDATHKRLPDLYKEADQAAE